MTPSLPLPEVCHELFSPALHAWAEDVLVALLTTPPVARTLMKRTMVLEGDLHGPDDVVRAGKGSSTPGRSGVSLAVSAPACQQPLAADRGLSHWHLNESSFVVVLSFPAFAEHTPPGGQASSCTVT